MCKHPLNSEALFVQACLAKAEASVGVVGVDKVHHKASALSTDEAGRWVLLDHLRVQDQIMINHAGHFSSVEPGNAADFDLQCCQKNIVAKKRPICRANRD